MFDSFPGFYNPNVDYDSIISDPNFSLEKILADDNMISDIRNGNEKILKFLNHEKVRKLISFVTEMPNQEEGLSRCFKYPFSSCEILSSELKEIYDIMFKLPPASENHPQSKINNEDDEVVHEDPSSKENIELSPDSLNRAEDFPLPQDQKKEIENQGEILKKQEIPSKSPEKSKEDQPKDNPKVEEKNKSPELPSQSLLLSTQLNSKPLQETSNDDANKKNEENIEIAATLNSQENKIKEEELVKLLDFQLEKMESKDEGLAINVEFDEEKGEISKVAKKDDQKIKENINLMTDILLGKQTPPKEEKEGKSNDIITLSIEEKKIAETVTKKETLKEKNEQIAKKQPSLESTSNTVGNLQSSSDSHTEEAKDKKIGTNNKEKPNEGEVSEQKETKSLQNDEAKIATNDKLNKGENQISQLLPENEINIKGKIENKLDTKNIIPDLEINSVYQPDPNNININQIEKSNEIQEEKKETNDNLTPRLEYKGFVGNGEENSLKNSENIEDKYPDYYSKPLISILLEFLNSDEELNIVLLGYFSKIIISLINKFRIDILTVLFNQKVMERIVYHSYNKSISEILLKMIIRPDLPESGLGEVVDINETFKQNLVSALIQTMIDSDSTDQIISNAQVIARLADSKVMTNYLCENSVLEKIQKISFRHNPVALRSGLTIIITLIRVLSDKEYGNEEFMQKVKKVAIEIFSYLKNVLELITNSEVQKHQHGNDIPVVGLALIKIVEFFTMLIKVKDIDILNKIADLNFPTLLLKLFDRFYMNSNLHFKIYSFFEEVIKSNIPSLLKCIITETKLAEYIIQTMNNPYTNYSSMNKKKFWKPNIVFITKMANILIKESEINTLIKDYLNSNSIQKEWENYVKNILSIINEKETKKIEKTEESYPGLIEEDKINNVQTSAQNAELKNEMEYSANLDSNLKATQETSNIIEEIITDEKDEETKYPEEIITESKAEVAQNINIEQKVEPETDQKIEQNELEENQAGPASENSNNNENINHESKENKENQLNQESQEIEIQGNPEKQESQDNNIEKESKQSDL